MVAGRDVWRLGAAETVWFWRQGVAGHWVELHIGELGNRYTGSGFAIKVLLIPRFTYLSQAFKKYIE